MGDFVQGLNAEDVHSIILGKMEDVAAIYCAG